MLIYWLKAAAIMETLIIAALVLFRLSLRPSRRSILTAGDIAPMLLIPLVGLFGHNKNVFYAFLFALPLTWAGNPARLVRRYCLTLVLFPEVSGLYVVGSVYLGTWSALLSFNAGALLALAFSQRGRMRPIGMIEVAMWAIYLLVLLTVIRGVASGAVFRFIPSTFLLVMTPYLIVSRGTASPAALKDALAFSVLGGLANAAIALFESVKHWALFETINMALQVKMAGISANLAVRAGLLRAGGAVLNYEALGLIVGVSLVTLVAIRDQFSKVSYYAVVGAIIVGLFASQARSAWIATIAGLVLYYVFERRWAHAFVLTGGLALAFASISVAGSAGGVVDQIFGTSGHGQTTSEYRQRLFTRSMEEARNHPLTGQTLDELQLSMNDLRQGEHIIDFVNTHLLVMLVGGFAALFCWAVAWFTPVTLAWLNRGRQSGQGSLLALPSAIVSMILVFLTFTSPIDRILPIATIAVGMTGVCIRLGRRAPTKGIKPRGSSRHRLTADVPAIHMS